MIFSHTTRKAFQNPWGIQKRLYREQLRYGDDARAREGMDEADVAALRVQYDSTKQAGKRTFENADHTFNPEAQKKRKFLNKSLRRFQAKTGINVDKQLARVETAKNIDELLEVERRLKITGIKYYKQEMEKSGLYVAMDLREKKFVDAEKKMYFEFIEDPSIPFDTDNEDETSFIETLSSLKAHLDERRVGRNRLAAQSSYVQNEFFRQIKSKPVTTNKDKLLENILAKIGGGKLEKEPSAIQVEFKKASKELPGNDQISTEVLLKNIQAEYKKRVDEYSGFLSEYAHLFGGKDVSTPKGKMRSARWEFEKWFTDLHGFNKMEDAKEKFFSTILPERKAAYEDRDELLEALPEGRRAIIREKTNEMRLHTLKAYLKESGSKEIRESACALEYIAELETAEYDGYPIFSTEEKRELKNVIKSSTPEVQEAEYTVLKARLIPERARVTADYLALPNHLRDDQKFFYGSRDDKRKIVNEARAQEDRELKHPFDVSNLSSLDQEERASLLLTKLHSAEGKQEANNIRRGLAQAGRLQQSQTQLEIMGVMAGQWQKNKTKNETQVEGMLTGMYEGAQVNNPNLWKAAFGESSEAKDPHQKWMAETARSDYQGILADRTRTWNGRALKVGKVTRGDRGKKSMLDRFGDAVWPENMLFLDAEGKDDLNPDKTARKDAVDFMEEDLHSVLEAAGIDINLVPDNFKAELIRICILGEHAGLYSRVSHVGGDKDLIDEVIN